MVEEATRKSTLPYLKGARVRDVEAAREPVSAMIVYLPAWSVTYENPVCFPASHRPVGLVRCDLLLLLVVCPQ
jgi:hypothetical protein